MNRINSCLEITEDQLNRLASDYASREFSHWPSTKEAFVDGFLAAVRLLSECGHSHDKIKLISEV